jgi:hypothetical protein
MMNIWASFSGFPNVSERVFIFRPRWMLCGWKTLKEGKFSESNFSKLFSPVEKWTNCFRKLKQSCGGGKMGLMSSTQIKPSNMNFSSLGLAECYITRSSKASVDLWLKSCIRKKTERNLWNFSAIKVTQQLNTSHLTSSETRVHLKM